MKNLIIAAIIACFSSACAVYPPVYVAHTPSPYYRTYPVQPQVIMVPSYQPIRVLPLPPHYPPHWQSPYRHHPHMNPYR